MTGSNKIVSRKEEENENDHQSVNNFERKKDETSEERRARKHAVKEIRRVNFEILMRRKFFVAFLFRIDEF